MRATRHHDANRAQAQGKPPAGAATLELPSGLVVARSATAASMTDLCPKAYEHTPAPRGYLAWQEWAERKSKTHIALRHVTCGLYGIWVRKANVRRDGTITGRMAGRVLL